MKKLVIEYLPMTAITPYDGNAKEHPEKQVGEIVQSIKQFGFDDPIAVWGEKNVIVEGHGRLLALQKMSEKERAKAGVEKEMVPVIRLDHLTEEERRKYILVHNKTNMDSGFSLDILNAELAKIDDADFNLTFNFAMPEDETEAVDDDFDPTPPEEPKTKAGQVWLLGRHRLMCGDSTSPEDMQKLMGGQLADLYLTDPPYNVNYEGATKDKLKIQNDNMEDEDFRQFLCNAFLAAKSVMKAGATFYIWHADSEGYNFRGACRDVDWQVRQCLIWEKNSMVLGRQDYQWSHEPCLYGWNNGSHTWYSDRKQTTVLHFDKPTRSSLHPTMKPIPLFDYLIKNSSKEGDIVLDSFGGSGTTMMACEQNGRTAYSMELDPRYAEVIIKRYAEFKKSDSDIYLLDGDKKIPWKDYTASVE